MNKTKKQYILMGILLFLGFLLFLITVSTLKSQNKTYQSNKKGNIAYASKSSKTSPIYEQNKKVEIVGLENKEETLKNNDLYLEQKSKKEYNIEILIAIICLSIAFVLSLFLVVLFIFIIKKRNKKIKE